MIQHRRTSHLVWILGLVLGAAATPRAEILERVLAVVDGQVITLTDVVAAREFGFIILQRNEPDQIRATMNPLIDRELMLAEVERYAPSEPTGQEVTQALEVVRARFGTEREYQDALTRSGIDESHLRATLRQSLRIRAYLNQRFAVPPADASGGAASGDRQQTLIDEWVAGLRRRATVIDLYLTSRN